MKKNVIFLALLTSSFAFGQVGFNTPDPQATVDIVAKNATGKSTNVDGLLVPRVDRERAQAMDGVPVSTLIYVNSVATGSQAGKAANIDAVGYYYYNGTAWVKLESANQNLNIYTSDGTLSDNRTVKQEDKKLAFTGTANNAFSIDGSTFSVDAGKNTVGIGTTTPGSKLSIIGNLALGTNYAGLSAPSNGAIIEGAVGIGTSNTSTAKFRVLSQNDDTANEYHFDDYSGSNNKYNAIRFHKSRGTLATPANLNNGDNIGSIEFIPHFNGTIESYHNGTGINAKYEGNGTDNLTSLRFFTSGDMPLSGERMRIDPTGKVGIGTQAPTHLLHVNSSTAGALKIVDGTQGTDKVLTSDADGVATWKELPASGGTSDNIYTTDGTIVENRTVTQNNRTLAFTGTSTNAFSVDGSTLSVDAANNRIGVGTTAPVSDLQVVGNELRLGGPSSQAGTVANPLLRIHSNANTDGSGGEIRFNEDSDSYGYYIRHNTEAGNTYGLDGLAIGAANPGNYSYNPAKPGMFVASSQNIGFGTATPQTIFHVDAARDNNINTAPSATQQANDFAITPAGTVGIGNLSPRGALDINKGETNNHGIVLPTNPNVNNFTNPLGGSVIPGTIVYDSTNDCVRFYRKTTNTWSKCIDGEGSGTVTPGVGTITGLDCANASNSGTLTSGISASNVSSSISYTGGNGGSHNGQTITSTGVTGLTATLPAGSFTGSTGILTYTITGTPSGSGTANFAINIGGKTCTLTRSVSLGSGTVTSLDCANVEVTGGYLPNKPVNAASTAKLSYTGGNGGAYPAQDISSGGVQGLVAHLDAGNFNIGNGKLTFKISGTPQTSGTATFNINIGGQNCTFNIIIKGDNSSYYSCTSAGYFGFPDYSRYYVYCENIGNGVLKQWLFYCESNGTVYNPNHKQCYYEGYP
ncbi:hypothetical protein [Chryseobacterium sp. SIMBA_038]|uniref:hypothetical protein n=2 Tax=Pseudomonadati TaxID=3379134 RepID=UPI00397E47C1